MMKQPFTADTLRAMFKEKDIIKGDLKLPSVDGFAYLAAVIEYQAWLAGLANGQWRQLEEYRKKLGKALVLLDEVIPGLRTQLRDADGFYDPPTTVFQAEVCALDTLAAASAMVKQRYYLVKPSGPDLMPQMDKWHGYGRYLIAAFFEAMHENNPDHKIAYSNTGPLARFLVEAIRHISGENPSPATVVQYLKPKDGEKLPIVNVGGHVEVSIR